jgi:hypothetical protein
MDKAALLDFTIEIVERSDTAQGFELIPRTLDRRANRRIDRPPAAPGARL